MMTTLSRIATALALVGLLGPLAACPKNANLQTFDEETLATDPRANFVMGVQELQTPDRKTGAVNYSKAYDFFQKSANLDPTRSAHFNAGWTSEVLGQLEDAERHYRKAFELDAAHKPSMFSLARVLSELDRGDDAVAIFQAYLEANPQDLEVRNDLIAALTSAGRYDEAVQEAHEILRHDPKNVDAYRNLSAMYYAKGAFGMSQLANEKAIQLDDSDPGTYNNMGVTYLQQEREAEAIERFQTAVKLDSANYEANTNLGYIALDSGDYALARQSFEAAVKGNPASVEAKMGLAVSLRGSGEYDRAGALYDEIITADPGNEAAYYNAATLHEVYTRDFEKALEYLQKYVDANPVSPGHDVFARMDRVKQAKAAEEERKRLEAEKKRQEEERRKRNEQLLADMTSVVEGYTAKFEANAGCLDEMMVEEGKMILEQAGMVVEMEDADMAADIKMMLEGYTPTWDEAIAGCAGGGGGAEEPAEEPTE